MKNSPHPEFWTSCLFHRSASIQLFTCLLKKGQNEEKKLGSRGTASLPDPAKFNPNQIWPNNKSNPIVKDSVKNSPHPEVGTCLQISFSLILPFFTMEGSQGWTKPSGGATVCSPGWSGVTAELAELALVNQVDDGTKELKSWNWKTISRWTWTSFSCLLMKCPHRKRSLDKELDEPEPYLHVYWWRDIHKNQAVSNSEHNMNHTVF